MVINLPIVSFYFSFPSYLFVIINFIMNETNNLKQKGNRKCFNDQFIVLCSLGIESKIKHPMPKTKREDVKYTIANLHLSIGLSIT